MPSAAGPKRIVASIRGEPPALNSLIARSVRMFSLPGGAELERLVMVGLTTDDENGAMHPALAEAAPSLENGLWRLLPDGRMETTWKVKPNARWHDGERFTADDALFALDVARDPEFPALRDVSYDAIESAEITAPDTLVVTWSKPYVYADTLFTGLRALPLPRHILGDTHTSNKSAFLDHPFWMEGFVGTGPFKLTDLVRGSHLTLAANDDYVLGRPRIDEIEVRFIPDANVVVSNVLAGAVDMTLGRSVALDQVVQAREMWHDGSALVSVNSWVQVEPQFLNPTPALVLDVRFRRALIEAIDRQQMADTLQYGLVPVAHGFLGPAQPEYRDVESSYVRYPYDPAHATRVIEELGYAKGADGVFHDAAGQRLQLETRVTADNPTNGKAMLSVSDYWQQLGIAVDPVVVPTQRTSDREYQATFPSFFFRRQPNTVQDLLYLHGSQTPLPSNNYVGRNYARYQNPEFDALIDAVFVAVPRPERIQALRATMHHLTDQLVRMGLFYDAASVLVTNRLKSVTIEAQGWNAETWTLQSS